MQNDERYDELAEAAGKLLRAIREADDQRRKTALGYVIPESLYEAVLDAAGAVRRASF